MTEIDFERAREAERRYAERWALIYRARLRVIAAHARRTRPDPFDLQLAHSEPWDADEDGRRLSRWRRLVQAWRGDGPLVP